MDDEKTDSVGKEIERSLLRVEFYLKSSLMPWFIGEISSLIRGSSWKIWILNNEVSTFLDQSVVEVANFSCQTFSNPGVRERLTTLKFFLYSSLRLQT